MNIGIDWRFPVTLRLDGASVALHAIMETLGIFIAFRYYLWLRRRRGDAIGSSNRLWIIIAATFGAVAGSHLLGALENLPEWRAAPGKWAYFWGNKTLVGGLLGGLWGVEMMKLAIGERQRSGDLFVRPLLLGMLIGRLGCFSMGVHEQTYGLPAHLPWAMDLGDGIARHPVVIYEIVYLAGLWTALELITSRRKPAPGAIFKLFMIGYLVFRFALDLVKPGWRYLAGLGSIQLACLAGLIYYYRDILHPGRLLGPKSPAHAS